MTQLENYFSQLDHMFVCRLVEKITTTSLAPVLLVAHSIGADKVVCASRRVNSTTEQFVRLSPARTANST